MGTSLIKNNNNYGNRAFWIMLWLIKALQGHWKKEIREC